MKKKERNSITLILAIIGSYLFFKEEVGVNVLVFTLFSAIAVVYLNVKRGLRPLIYAIAPAILCSVFVVVYPQSLTFAIWLLSFLIMWSSMLEDSYPITTVVQGFVSIFESCIGFFHKKKYSGNLEKEKMKQGIIYLISAFIVIVFLMLYVNSNPVFNDFFSRIDLSFIQFGFVMMTIGLYILLYGLVLIKKNKDIQNLNSIKQEINKTQLSIRDEQEFKIAKLSITIVALLLFIANITDLFILFTGKLPAGMSYSEYVHQGFYTLIFTLSLAVGLIIYFYRGQLNFHDKIKQLKNISIFWILQNLLLALLTAYKNYLYVEVYGLTYKRIAVFLGLLCIIIGLILSLNKLKQPLTNWFYFNKLALYAYISLFFISFIPFDKLITKYNLTNSQTIDIEYILNLEHPDLLFVDDFIHKTETTYSRDYRAVHDKLSKLSVRANKANWQSWNLYMKNYQKVE